MRLLTAVSLVRVQQGELLAVNIYVFSAFLFIRKTKKCYFSLKNTCITLCFMVLFKSSLRQRFYGGIYIENGSMVKRLRHRPFTAVTGVQIPLESLKINKMRFWRLEADIGCYNLIKISTPMWLNWQSS